MRKNTTDHPIIAMDYKSLGQGRGEMLVLRDQGSKVVGATFVQCKGIGDEYVVEKILGIIDYMRYSTFTLKTDREPALVQVAKEIKVRRIQETYIENPPAYDPQANGLVEKTVQAIMNQFRAIQLGLEQNIGKNVAEDELVIQ